jgi:hypothetical protein
MKDQEKLIQNVLESISHISDKNLRKQVLSAGHMPNLYIGGPINVAMGIG